MTIFPFEELKNKALNFYKLLSINVPTVFEGLAVQSLTMSQFAKEYNDVNEHKIGDHRALATVGDSICGSFVMLKEFKKNSTRKELTDKKEIVTNQHLNSIGKKLLEGKLFATNTDLQEMNKKDYATSFEAIIGFIALVDKKEAFRILGEYLK